MRNASVPRTDDGPRRGRIATRRTASARAPQLAGTPAAPFGVIRACTRVRPASRATAVRCNFVSSCSVARDGRCVRRGGACGARWRHA